MAAWFLEKPLRLTGAHEEARDGKCEMRCQRLFPRSSEPRDESIRSNLFAVHYEATRDWRGEWYIDVKGGYKCGEDIYAESY